MAKKKEAKNVWKLYTHLPEECRIIVRKIQARHLIDTGKEIAQDEALEMIIKAYSK